MDAEGFDVILRFVAITSSRRGVLRVSARGTKQDEDQGILRRRCSRSGS
jgi:hypothetical protein